MEDYSAMKAYSEKNNLHHFTLSPNSEKPIKSLIHHLSPDTPVEVIVNSLENLGFNFINMKQMTVTQLTTPRAILPLFLVTLTRNIKSQKIFKLYSLNHIIIMVEFYRAQTGLPQCYSCQNFGHVWASYKQLTRCLWSGGGHLRMEYPEKTNTEFTPSC
jgi:hypothetical protein